MNNLCSLKNYSFWLVIIISYMLYPTISIAKEQCNSPSVFDSVCKSRNSEQVEPMEVKLFDSQEEFADYISSKKYTNLTLGEFVKEIEKLGFTCGHPHRKGNTEWQCGRVVFESNCSEQIQMMAVTTKFFNNLNQGMTEIKTEQANIKKIENFHPEDWPKYQKMKVMSASAILTGTYSPKSVRCPSVERSKNPLWE